MFGSLSARHSRKRRASRFPPPRPRRPNLTSLGDVRLSKLHPLYSPPNAAAIIIASGLIKIRCKQTAYRPTRTLHPRRLIDSETHLSEVRLATENNNDEAHYIQ